MKSLISLFVIGILGAAGYSATDHAEESAWITNPSLSHSTWISGHWKGKAWDGVGEEIWSQPAAGTMMGMYRFVKNNQVVFYEFMTLDEKDSKITLKIKHFNNDFTGWEAKDKWVEFPFVRQSADKLEFDGLSFQKIGADSIQITVLLGEKGKEKLVSFRKGRQ